MSGRHIADGLAKGIGLRGDVRQGNSSRLEGFGLRDFEIDIERHQAICPAGKKQVGWVKAKPRGKNLIAHRVRFGTRCQSCPSFGPNLCTDRLKGRCLGISAYHPLIQARRREAESEAFKREMQIRAGIEATVSELVRKHGLCARYRGRRKNQLQTLLIATATNLKRLADRSFVSIWAISIPMSCQGTQAA